jgi:hypothetical protein
MPIDPAMSNVTTASAEPFTRRMILPFFGEVIEIIELKSKSRFFQVRALQ